MVTCRLVIRYASPNFVAWVYNGAEHTGYGVIGLMNKLGHDHAIYTQKFLRHLVLCEESGKGPLFKRYSIGKAG